MYFKYYFSTSILCNTRKQVPPVHTPLRLCFDWLKIHWCRYRYMYIYKKSFFSPYYLFFHLALWCCDCECFVFEMLCVYAKLVFFSFFHILTIIFFVIERGNSAFWWRWMLVHLDNCKCGFWECSNLHLVEVLGIEYASSINYIFHEINILHFCRNANRTKHS